MNQEHYEDVKEAILAHIQNLFQEMEENMAMSHQEKYALLEDAFENASDVNELRVAFEQWHVDHAEDIGLDASVEELWNRALRGDLNYDSLVTEKNDEEDLADEKDGLEFKNDYKSDYDLE